MPTPTTPNTPPIPGIPTPAICPVTHDPCISNPTVRARQYRIERIDNVERWVKLVAAIATLTLVIGLAVAVVWQGSRIETLSENDKIQGCTLTAIAKFAAGTGQAFNTPPAPNDGRSDAVNTILKSVPALEAAAKGECIKP